MLISSDIIERFSKIRLWILSKHVIRMCYLEINNILLCNNETIKDYRLEVLKDKLILEPSDISKYIFIFWLFHKKMIN